MERNIYEVLYNYGRWRMYIDLKSSSPYNPVVSVAYRPLIYAVDAELGKLELS